MCGRASNAKSEYYKESLLLSMPKPREISGSSSTLLGYWKPKLGVSDRIRRDRPLLSVLALYVD